MEHLFEKWQFFLLEQDEPQQVITFDFDSTLSLSHWGEEEDWWVHDGPHEEFIEKIKQYIQDPTKKVFIVTSRLESQEKEALEDEKSVSVQEFLDEYDIKVEGIHFTNGESKIETLLKLGSTLHHDDDPADIHDARENGIEAVVSDPYGDYSKLEASELKDRGIKELDEHTEPYQKEIHHGHRKKKYRLIGKGKNSYNVGGKMKRPSYKRSKSAPALE